VDDALPLGRQLGGDAQREPLGRQPDGSGRREPLGRGGKE
jgi:hypothetical protein